MAEHYEVDEYSFEEHSEESINVGSVCSWSINDISRHRPVVQVRIENCHFNSDLAQISDHRLYDLADRLHQAENGDPTARIGRHRRAVRGSLRDYEQEAWWASMYNRPARRIGARLELEPVPNERYCPVLRRKVIT